MLAGMRNLAGIFAAATLLSAALTADCQKFLPKSIQFKGAPDYTDQELMDAAGLTKDAVLSYAEMGTHSQKLMDTGVFASLSFKFDGQDLIFELTPLAQLLPIRLENFPPAADNELDEKLHQRFPLYHGKVPTEGGLTDGVRDVLVEILSAQGIKATIEATPFTDAALHKVTAVSYTITSPPIQVGEVKAESTSAALEPKVLAMVAQQRGAPYDAEGSRSIIENNLNTYYRENGYLEAEIQAKPAPTPVISPDAVHIPFLVSIAPGIQYRIAAIHLAPDLVVTQANFDRQSHIHRGDIADGEHIRENWQFLSRQYHNCGYVKAQVRATPTFDRAGGTVSYEVNVDPGPLYTMGTLTIENVSDDLRAAMLSAWKMPAGSIFNEGAILGFFATHDVNPALERIFSTVDFTYAMHLNDDTRTVDLKLKLEKKH